MSDLAVVCALEFERARLARTLRAPVTLHRCGPGPANADAGVRILHERGIRRCILAGVAGGLREGVLCPPVQRVIDAHGNAWTPTIRLEPGAGESGTTLIGVDAPVGEPADKGALADAHDATLVDCESHAFGRTAAELGMAWGVVRAVSDGVTDRLPPEVLAWTDERGRTRVARVMGDLARHPSLLSVSRRLARDAGRAMNAVADALDRMLAIHDGETHG